MHRGAYISLLCFFGSVTLQVSYTSYIICICVRTSRSAFGGEKPRVAQVWRAFYFKSCYHPREVCQAGKTRDADYQIVKGYNIGVASSQGFPFLRVATARVSNG